MGGFLANNGMMIRAPLGGFYDGLDTDCCCCCCLEKYTHGVDPADEFTAVISGALGGTGTLILIGSAAGYCLTWQGTIAILSPSCGGFINAVITIACPEGSSDPGDIEITLTVDNPPFCEVIPLGADPILPDSASCNELDLVYTDRWETNDVAPGTCTCGDGTKISIQVTFP